LNGIVTLTGHIPNYPAKWSAMDATKKVRGVRIIGDEIEIDLPKQQRRDDGDIAARVAKMLEWTIPELGRNVKAIVRNGFVTLSGLVDWQHQREQVEKQIRHTRGVAGIANLIELKRAPTPAHVNEKIEDALRRSAKLEARNVKVSVQEDTVILDGKLNAEYERELARNAGWAAPSVRCVVDNIEVA